MGQREEKELTSGEGCGAFISEKRKSPPHLGRGPPVIMKEYTVCGEWERAPPLGRKGSPSVSSGWESPADGEREGAICIWGKTWHPVCQQSIIPRNPLPLCHGRDHTGEPKSHSPSPQARRPQPLTSPLCCRSDPGLLSEERRMSCRGTGAQTPSPGPAPSLSQGRPPLPPRGNVLPQRGVGAPSSPPRGLRSLGPARGERLQSVWPPTPTGVLPLGPKLTAPRGPLAVCPG